MRRSSSMPQWGAAGRAAAPHTVIHLGLAALRRVLLHVLRRDVVLGVLVDLRNRLTTQVLQDERHDIGSFVAGRLRGGAVHRPVLDVLNTSLEAVAAGNDETLVLRTDRQARLNSALHDRGGLIIGHPVGGCNSALPLI